MVVSKVKNSYGSNVVSKEVMRNYQMSVLEFLKNTLENSFGPYGSNTCIKKDMTSYNNYTKDGYTILSSIKFSGIIEESIRSDIETITQHIASTVGDGTTSAVVMSYYLLKALNTSEVIEDNMPYDINRAMQKAVDNIKEIIYKSSRPATIDDIYNISYLASNGNEFVANTMTDIYKQFGMDVFIDVGINSGKDTAIKTYDGMTLNTGYGDVSYVNNTEDNTCVIDHPNIYFFEDPVDTKEMGVLFNAIIDQNITSHMKDGAMVPTVIVAPKVTRDMAPILDQITNYQAQVTGMNKLPFLLISDTHQREELMDIAKMCGGITIHKYIDREIYNQDVADGNAPTPETVTEFANHCEQIVAGSMKTKFINPILMKDENGDYSSTFKNYVSFVESALKKAIADGEDSHTIGKLRRRINSLKSNLVEIDVGGLTVADRDSLRDLIEDSVKNCRSAAIHGVGFGANMSGKLAAADYLKTFNPENPDLDYYVARAIDAASANTICDLYATMFTGDLKLEKAASIMANSEANRKPFNIRTKKFDDKVVSSIESDIVILDSVSKILSIMFTCNQFLTPNPQLNVYAGLVEVGDSKDN